MKIRLKVSRMIPTFLVTLMLLVTLFGETAYSGAPFSGWISDRLVYDETVGRRPSMATDSEGNLYIAYEWYNTYYGVYGIRVVESTDGGDTWSIIHGVSSDTYDYLHPSIAIDVYNDNIFVVYEREKAPGDHDILLDWRPRGSVTWTYKYIDNDADDDRYPSITCEYWRGASNYLYISYEYLYSSDDRDLMFAKSTDDGETWDVKKLRGESPVDPPPYNEYVFCQTSITTTRGSDGKDYIYIAYKWGEDYITAYDIYVLKSTDRGSTWTNQKVLDESSRNKMWPSIAATHGGGTVVIAWHVYYESTYSDDIQYAYSTSNGASWTPGWLAQESGVEERTPTLTVNGQGSSDTDVKGWIHVAYFRHYAIYYKKAHCYSPEYWRQAERVTDETPDARASGIYPKPAITTQKREGGWYPCVAWSDIRDAGNADIYYCTKTLVPNLYLVVRGLDNRIYYNVWTGILAREWTGWIAVPTGATSEGPAACTFPYPYDLHIVVRGMTGGLYHGRVNLTDGSFLGWTRISGETPSAPTMTRREYSLYLVVRGLDDRVYYRVWDGSSWSGWAVIPTGRTCDSPAAAILGGRLHIVVRGMTGGLWHASMNLTTSVWSGWSLIPGVTSSPPALAALEYADVGGWVRKLFLVVRGLDDRIYYNVWDTSAWTGWAVLPGQTCEGPAAKVFGKLHIVVRGMTGGLWHGNVDLSTSAFSGWTRVPGDTPSRPVLA